MEQIQKLFEILSETPQMALWGLAMYFLFILLKIASWVGSLTIVVKEFIKRYFDWKERDQDIKKEQMLTGIAQQILDLFERRKISSVSKSRVIELFSAIRRDGGQYIHDSDIDEAITAIKKSKEAKK